MYLKKKKIIAMKPRRGLVLNITGKTRAKENHWFNHDGHSKTDIVSGTSPLVEGLDRAYHWVWGTTHCRIITKESTEVNHDWVKKETRQDVCRITILSVIYLGQHLEWDTVLILSHYTHCSNYMLNKLYYKSFCLSVFRWIILPVWRRQ